MAVEAAWKAGIVVVAAAGNEGAFGPGGILSPGNDPYVITVGALDTQQTATTSDDTVCSYSSIGPTLYDEIAKPDVVAPGNRDISLRVAGSYLDLTAPQNRIAVSSYIPNAPSWAPPVYFMLSGTSTSAPVVSGLAALMISADPSLTPDDVKARLMATADKIAGANPAQEGAGEVDAAAALASTLVRQRLRALPDGGHWNARAFCRYKRPLEQLQVDQVSVDQVSVDQVSVDRHQLDQVPVDGADPGPVSTPAPLGQTGTAVRHRTAVPVYVGVVATAAAVCLGLAAARLAASPSRWPCSPSWRWRR